MSTFPGLTVLDAPQRERPNVPVGTSTGAFVGVTEKGPVGVATPVTSWGEYVRIFGSYVKDHYLAYAVRGFFANGGSLCYVTRVAKNSAPATAEIENLGGSQFDFAVFYGGELVESYSEVTPANFVETLEASQYVTVEYDAELEMATVTAKSDGTWGNNLAVRISDGPLIDLEGGNDGVDGLSDTDYIEALSSFDSADINLVAIPGLHSVAIHNALIGYCADRGDCFAVLDPPPRLNVTEMKDYKSTIQNSDYAAIYYPWLVVSDPIGTGQNPVAIIPPSGHVMGVMARIDTNRGVWKAPAGVEATIHGVLRTEREITDGHQAILNPKGINCLRTFTDAGLVIWGSRTLNNTIVSRQRLKIYIKTWFRNNFKWVVFEPIDDTILGNNGTVSVQGRAFMHTLYTDPRGGAFDGDTPETAYFVQCDRENNPEESIAQNKLNIAVGYRYKGVAEFVTITVGPSN